MIPFADQWVAVARVVTMGAGMVTHVSRVRVCRGERNKFDIALPIIVLAESGHSDFEIVRAPGASAAVESRPNSSGPRSTTRTAGRTCCGGWRTPKRGCAQQ